MAKRQKSPQGRKPKPKAAPAGILIGYARVSTSDQNLHMQTEALIKAGVSEQHLYTDKSTGRTLKRKGLQEALLDARPGDTFVIWKMDRLSRDALDMLYLAKQFRDEGIHLRSLTESLDTSTPIGWFALGMMALVAQFESDNTGFRTKRGMSAAARLGRKFGPKATFRKQHFERAVRMLKSGLSAEAVGKHFGVTGQVIRIKLFAQYGRKFWKAKKRKPKQR